MYFFAVDTLFKLQAAMTQVSAACESPGRLVSASWHSFSALPYWLSLAACRASSRSSSALGPAAGAGSGGEGGVASTTVVVPSEPPPPPPPPPCGSLHAVPITATRASSPHT